MRHTQRICIVLTLCGLAGSAVAQQDRPRKPDHTRPTPRQVQPDSARKAKPFRPSGEHAQRGKPEFRKGDRAREMARRMRSYRAHTQEDMPEGQPLPEAQDGPQGGPSPDQRARFKTFMQNHPQAAKKMLEMRKRMRDRRANPNGQSFEPGMPDQPLGEEAKGPFREKVRDRIAAFKRHHADKAGNDEPRGRPADRPAARAFRRMGRAVAEHKPGVRDHARSMRDRVKDRMADRRDRNGGERSRRPIDRLRDHPKAAANAGKRLRDHTRDHQQRPTSSKRAGHRLKTKRDARRSKRNGN